MSLSRKRRWLGCFRIVAIPVAKSDMRMIQRGGRDLSGLTARSNWRLPKNQSARRLCGCQPSERTMLLGRGAGLPERQRRAKIAGAASCRRSRCGPGGTGSVVRSGRWQPVRPHAAPASNGGFRCGGPSRPPGGVNGGRQERLPVRGSIRRDDGRSKYRHFPESFQCRGFRQRRNAVLTPAGSTKSTISNSHASEAAIGQSRF